MAGLSVEDSANFQVEQISNGTLNRFVAADDQERVVGYAVYGVLNSEPFPGEWFLFALYVLPGFQGGGLGRELLECVMSKGREEGFQRITFGVFSQNAPSKQFYVHQGAELIHTLGYELGGKTYPTDYMAIPL